MKEIQVIPTLLDQIVRTSQSELFRVLYDGKAPLSSATPEGFSYFPVQVEKNNEITPARIGYFGPHPSDLPDFIGGITSQLTSASMHEFLLTEGELGAEPLSKEETRRIRRKETLDGAQILGNEVSVLSTQHGEVLPDGDVISHLGIATQLVKKNIKNQDLSIIIAPGPEVDHPDHVATFLAVTNALKELGEEGYFTKKELPAFYITDPEYGYSSGGNWAKEKVRQVVRDYPYLADNQAFVMPEFIVDISRGMQKATASLLAHTTQMKGKEYLWKIPMLKRVRGQQIGKEWGEALRQVILPGITKSENSLQDHVNGKMYQRISA